MTATKQEIERTEAYKQRATNCVLLRKQTFTSSAGPRFAVIGLL